MSMILNNLLLSPEGYQISRSVRLRSSASAYFNRTPASAGNRQTWTWSGWVKRGALGTDSVLFYGGFSASANNTLRFNADNSLTIFRYDSAITWQLTTSQVFRDPSAWYHIIFAVDTTQATAANRVKIYVNGLQVTSLSTATYPSQNLQGDINNTVFHAIGNNAATNYFDGYLTEINLIDGQALTPSSFGENNTITGVWQPKKYTGTYGTNGFYLNFSDNSAATAAAIGKDYSGNGNNWTPNNISVTSGATYDSMLDVPTQWADGGNGRGNYAVLNPLDYVAAAFSGTASNGNLTVSIPAPTNSNGLASTIRVVSAAQPKFYIETTITALNTVCSLGMISGTNANYRLRHTADITLAVNDVVMTAFDPATGKVWYGRNGTWLSSGNPAAGTNQWDTIPADQVVGSAYSILATNGSTGTFTTSTTFGQQPFTYTPPSGFKALNTLNLPEQTILKGNQYFDATTYTGTGATQTITVDFAPNFAWLKRRDGAGENVLMDTLRLTGSLPNRLFSNSTAAESTAADGQNSFSSTGIVLDGTGGGGEVNTSGRTYVGWQWKEGATQGFDIVTYTGNGTSGRTISHSLGVAPAMMIVKSRNGADNWNVYHRSIGASYWLQLNTTSAQINDGTSGAWNNTAPTSSVFTVNWPGLGGYTNQNTITYVAYLFAEVAGFSRFGSYTGNGSADGPFVFLGFRPKFVMWKNASAAEAWLIEDTSRSTYNQVALELYPSSSGAEAAGSSRSPTQQFDFLSNGFKVRGAQSQSNGNGNTIIFAAFAESPFKTSLAR